MEEEANLIYIGKTLPQNNSTAATNDDDDDDIVVKKDELWIVNFDSFLCVKKKFCPWVYHVKHKLRRQMEESVTENGQQVEI